MTQLDTYLKTIASDIRGLFYHDLAVTGRDPSTILLQALFHRYPELFLRLDCDFPYTLILSRNEIQQLQWLQSRFDLDPVETLARATQIELQPEVEIAVELPDSSILLPMLTDHPDFKVFPRLEKIRVLIENLIIEYHMLIQPEHLTKIATQSDTRHYQQLSFVLTTKQIAKLYDEMPTSTYATDRIDHFLKSRLYKAYKYYLSLEQME